MPSENATFNAVYYSGLLIVCRNVIYEAANTVKSFPKTIPSSSQQFMINYIFVKYLVKYVPFTICPFCLVPIHNGLSGLHFSYVLLIQRLTPSTSAVRNCCCSKGSAPYWSNPLSPERQRARMPEIKNSGLDQYGKV